ncbi:MAG: MarR family transcriptional regulator [Thalassobaculales bacterium]
MPRLTDFLCFGVYAAGHAFTRVYKRLLAPLGLTYPQYLVMVALWERDGRTVGELGEALGLESSTLTPLLKRLEGLGHVTRRRDRADERQVRVALTAQGRALAERARGVPEGVAAATGMSPQALRKLTAEVAALHRALERAAGER